jgi:uncharacterized membrane protein
MSTTEQIVRGAVAGLLALGVASISSQALAQKAETEKCAGVAKAGKNDCGTSTTSCAGSIKTDRHAEAWILVPKGTCDKIAGGTVTTSAHARPGGAAGK